MAKARTAKKAPRKTKSAETMISVRQERRAERKVNWRPSIGSPTYEREG